MRFLVGVLAALAGCGPSGDTSVLLLVSEESPVSAPATVAVSVFEPDGLLTRRPLGMQSLPGAVVVQGLPNRSEELRVVVVADRAGSRLVGGGRVITMARARVSAFVVVKSGGDSDGDDVPDEIDDCPTTPDPDQDCSSDGGGGRDLRALDLASDGALDLAMPAPSDLANADLSTASLCPTTSAVSFCDGFESPTVNARWFENQLNGTVTVDNTRAFRGSSSIRIHQNAVAGGMVARANLVTSQNFPTPDLYVRVYAFVPSGFPGATTSVFIVEQTQGPYEGINLYFDNGNFTTFNSVGADVTKQSAVAVPLDRWTCLEWHVNMNAATGFSELRVDGVVVAGLGGNQNTAPAPPFGEIAIGMSMNAVGAVPAREYWLDEVIVDSEAIGCVQ